MKKAELRKIKRFIELEREFTLEGYFRSEEELNEHVALTKRYSSVDLASLLVDELERAYLINNILKGKLNLKKYVTNEKN